MMYEPRKKTPSMAFAKSQRGSVLAISLVFLVVLTLLGITVIRTTQTDVSVAGNDKNLRAARNAAETALRDGEMWLDQQRFYPSDKFCKKDQKCLEIEIISPADEKFDDAGDFLELKSSDWQEKGRELAVTVKEKPLVVSDVAMQPRRIIREARFIPDTMTRGTRQQPGRYLYEISAYGVAQDARISSTLQSTFIRRY